MPRSLNDAPDIRARMAAWQAEANELAFAYLRSGGGLMQTGRARITSLTDTSLTLEAAGTRLFVVLAGAGVDDSPQIFFTPDLRDHFQVAGVSIALANHDNLFLSDSANNEELERLGTAQRSLGWQPHS